MCPNGRPEGLERLKSAAYRRKDACIVLKPLTSVCHSHGGKPIQKNCIIAFYNTVYMKKVWLLCSLLLLVGASVRAQDKKNDFTTQFETSGGTQSATLKQATDFYKQLDKDFTQIQMEKAGNADGGYPIHVVYFSTDGDFNKTHWQKEGKIIILINNAIHAGEPDGVDASMMLVRDAAQGKITVPENVVLAIIPAYNIGGILNRNSFSRATQNGPESYGFRGNAQNLDLNRDFIKCDANETKTLQQLFMLLDPAVFIDNHVSDGADYQHLMTLIETQHNKLGGKTGDFMHNTLTPSLFKDMKKQRYDMVPYVNNFDNTPENGWTAFNEPPRFATGYMALFQTIGFVAESHMLKPYKDRVTATLDLMKCLIKEVSKNAATINEVRAADRLALQGKKDFVLDWKVDSSKHDVISFHGYASTHKPSEVSGLPRLFYDHAKPYTKDVPFYSDYKPTLTVKAPTAYIIPRGWTAVISRLKRNNVDMKPLPRDTTISVTAYHIENYETSKHPYEKHYLHYAVKVSADVNVIKFRKGDYLILLNQPAKRYLIETLEPTAPDAYFAWNFFDGILQQKEGFSDYVFEDKAADMLKNDAQLRKLLEEKRNKDTAFAHNAFAQLDFVYKHSPFFEPVYLRYPVYRVE